MTEEKTRRQGDGETGRKIPSASPRLLLAALLLSLGACKPAPSTAPKPEGPVTLAIPEQGAYTGAYIDFGDNEDDVTLERIEGFEKLVGKHQAIVASSSYWGEQTFPTANLNLIWRHGSIPLVFWSPWDRPYDQDRGPDRFSLTSIIEGKWDDYIDRWGDAARDFGKPFMVSFANEMNGVWFPWSGVFYGGKTVIPGTPVPPSFPPKLTPDPKVPGGFEAPPPLGPFSGPETFKKAYRHVVDRVRARGARNVLWVFHAVNYSYPMDNWNLIAQYYPGADYVDWLAYSVYGKQFSDNTAADDKWANFMPLLEWPYKEICTLDPNKPIMLAEWGVAEYAKSGSKPTFIRDALSSVEGQFPRLKAAVFWHERWQNANGEYSNLRANSSPESLTAYRQGVANPLWLDHPRLVPLDPPLPSSKPPQK